MASNAPELLAISDRRARGGRALAGWLDDVAAAGIDAVLLREKELDDRALYHAARAARSRLPAAVRLLLAGRLDVALAAGADGVHLPADGVPTALLRRRFGPGVLIGRSTHRLEEVRAARDDGADYVTFGPVFDTPSKHAYGPPAGVDALRRATAEGLPILALGGIDAARVDVVADAGAAGVAAIRAGHEPRARDALVAAVRRRWHPRPAAPGQGETR